MKMPDSHCPLFDSQSSQNGMCGSGDSPLSLPSPYAPPSVVMTASAALPALPPGVPLEGSAAQVTVTSVSSVAVPVPSLLTERFASTGNDVKFLHGVSVGDCGFVVTPIWGSVLNFAIAWSIPPSPARSYWRLVVSAVWAREVAV